MTLDIYPWPLSYDWHILIVHLDYLEPDGKYGISTGRFFSGFFWICEENVIFINNKCIYLYTLLKILVAFLRKKLEP